MLERLFGSSSRSKIIKFFVTHPHERYYMRELARVLDIKLNALSRELENLVELGMLETEMDQNKKYYSVDESFPLYQDLKSLIIRSLLLLERAVIRDLQSLKGIQLLILTGIFNGEDTNTDLLIVGSSIDKKKIQRLISTLSKSFHQDIRFTLLSAAEYKYRKEVTDKFLYKILNLSPIVIIDKIAK